MGLCKSEKNRRKLTRNAAASHLSLSKVSRPSSQFTKKYHSFYQKYIRIGFKRRASLTCLFFIVYITLFPSAPDYRIAVYRAFSLSRDPARAHHILDFSSPAKQFKSEITKKQKKNFSILLDAEPSFPIEFSDCRSPMNLRSMQFSPIFGIGLFES